MDKEEVRLRVSKDGKPINLDDFSWDAETKTFSSTLDGLLIDFFDIDDCTFIAGSDCTFKAGWRCTFRAGYGCTFKAGNY